MDSSSSPGGSGPRLAALNCSIAEVPWAGPRHRYSLLGLSLDLLVEPESQESLGERCVADIRIMPSRSEFIVRTADLRLSSTFLEATEKSGSRSIIWRGMRLA